MFSSNARLLLLEASVYSAVAALAYFFPLIRIGWLAQLSRAYARLAAKRGLAVLSVIGFVLAARGALLLVLPPPVPGVPDEFSYILAGQTFAAGRLTNPAHPLWRHFESFWIIQQPTYMSMYPPGQGFFMAIGNLLGGHPWIGVYLNIALMCGAICWMLQAWVPAQWALTGGLIAALRWGVYSYWIDSYWGGGVAALGGALVAGAVFRIFRGRSLWAPVILGLGLLLLANSRPFEGLVLGVTMGGALLLWMLGKESPGFPRLLTRVLLPLAAVLLVGAGAMAYYFWRVTGNPFHMPYQVNSETYAATNPFLWQPMRKPPVYRDSVMRNYYLGGEVGAFRRAHTLRGWAGETFRKATTFVFFYFWPAILPTMLALPFLLRNRKGRFAVIAGVIMLIGLALEVWPMTLHYHAPITGMMVLLLIQAMRYWNTIRWNGRPVGAAISRTVPWFCAAILAIRLGAVIMHVPVARGIVPWFTVTPGNLERAKILRYLQDQPGDQLVVVKYKPTHTQSDEWVYNEPDIDAAKVVWARDSGPESNAELLQYFRQRRVWLIEPDEKPPHLVPVASP